MTARHRSFLHAILFGALLASAGLSHAQLDADGQARIAALRNGPDAAGALIYRGATHALQGPAQEPLFRYERRLQALGQGVVASHATSDARGELIIIESAQMNQRHELRRLDVANRQGGFSATVLVSADGRQLQYRLQDKGKLSTAEETISAPAVTGTSMFGFILTHWDVLKAGARVPVRMLVPREKTSYGFDVRFEKEADGQTAFTVIPSSFLVRLAIAPLRVVFDATSRNPRRYEGRVPPMRDVAGTLKDLDARVDYTMVAPSYR